jgi:hypothetical protein
MDNFQQIIPFLIPIFVIQVGLQIYSIVNLVKRKRVPFNNKLIWGIIILCGGIFGSIIYLIFRGDDE